MYYQFCPFCGAQNPNDQARCPRCNRSLALPDTDDVLGDAPPRGETRRRRWGFRRTHDSAPIDESSTSSSTSTEAIGSSEFKIKGTTLVRYTGNDAIVIIPNGIITIGKRAFAGNKTIVSVTLPEGVKVIDHNAFSYCPNLVEVNLCNTLLAIGDYAFQHCLKLAKIFIPKSVAHIGKFAFWDDAGVTAYLEINLDSGGYAKEWHCYSGSSPYYYNIRCIPGASRDSF